MSKENNTLTAIIASRSEKITDPAQRTVRVISETEAQKICRQSAKSLREVYIAALDEGIWPLRYMRNASVLTAADQCKLAHSRVAVIGAGGLGGNVIMTLARMGIGHLTVADPDVFEESNLNRQLLATSETMGINKAEAAQKKITSVNPATAVQSQPVRLDAENAGQILKEANAAVDALDNVPSRRVLANACKNAGIPLVHAAIAGFEGQIMTVYPQDPGLEQIYGDADSASEPSAAPEAVLGVPAVTPAVLAALQAMETVKILLGRGRGLRGRMLYADLEDGGFQEFSFGAGPDQT